MAEERATLRRRSKATSAGSTLRQGSPLGRIVRGAFATRGASSDADGSGAPSARRALPLTTTLAALIALGSALALTAAPAAAAEACPNEEIRQQQGSTQLPDCMAYELVTPANTDGVDPIVFTGSADGEHAWFSTFLPTSASTTGNSSSLTAVRTPSGWKSTDLASTEPPGNDSYALLDVSTDYSQAIVFRCERILLGCLGDYTFERINSAGTRTIMAVVPRPNFFAPSPAFGGASDDLSRILIENDTSNGAPPLLPEDTHTIGTGLYLSHDGALQFIGYDQNGNVLECGAVPGGAPKSQSAGPGFEQTGVSTDGKTLVFTSPDTRVLGQGGCPEHTDVYVRHDEEVVDISAPHNGNPDEGAIFAGASRDGSVVYFTTTSQLVSEDSNSLNDIYAYNVAADHLTRLAPGADVQLGGSSEVPVTSVAVSPRGDYLYFVSNTPVGGEGAPGGSNLFAYHDGTTQLVISSPSNIFLGQPSNSPVRSPVTPDGTHLLFVSSGSLAGQPTNDTLQLFQYDYSGNSLACISCRPDGEPSEGDFGFAYAFPDATKVRDQSDDGQTVVFQSPERLVPSDTDSGRDVYLWHDGGISLLTDGHTEYQADTFANISASGSAVFFATTARLFPGVSQDNNKYYVARVDGGVSTPASTLSCDGEDCRIPSQALPKELAPASGSFEGPSNPGTRRHHHKRRHKKPRKRAHHRHNAKPNRGGVR